MTIKSYRWSREIREWIYPWDRKTSCPKQGVLWAKKKGGIDIIDHQECLTHAIIYLPSILPLTYMGLISEAHRLTVREICYHFPLLSLLKNTSQIIGRKKKSVNQASNTNPVERVWRCCEPSPATVYWRHKRWAGHEHEPAWLSAISCECQQFCSRDQKKEGQHGLR